MKFLPVFFPSNCNNGDGVAYLVFLITLLMVPVFALLFLQILKVCFEVVVVGSMDAPRARVPFFSSCCSTQTIHEPSSAGNLIKVVDGPNEIVSQGAQNPMDRPSNTRHGSEHLKVCVPGFEL